MTKEWEQHFGSAGAPFEGVRGGMMGSSGGAERNEASRDDFKLLELDSWKDVEQALLAIPSGWVFRGHARSDWPLQTSIERVLPSDKRDEDEAAILTHFQSRAHHFLGAQHVPGGTLEWLALLQHYGGPTRLLDCTTSPYVAAYFALEDDVGKERSAIWCIDRLWCIEETTRRFKRVVARSDWEAASLPHLLSLVDSEFTKWIMKSGINLVVPLSPRRLNDRITTQQGAFLCVGDVKKSFIENLIADSPDEAYERFMKITFPNRIRLEGLPRLRQMNVTRASLFPGLDGLAQSTKTLLVEYGPTMKALLQAIEGSAIDRATRPSLAQRPGREDGAVGER